MVNHNTYMRIRICSNMVEKINVSVSKAAKDVLTAYKKEHGYGNLDTALEYLLLEFNWDNPVD